jgi:hypothetical protein
MKLSEMLGSYSKDELKMICRNLELTGFGKLEKPELIQRISHFFSNPEVFKDFFTNTLDACLFFLSLFGNEKPCLADIPQFSKHVFYTNLKKLFTIGMVFMREDNREQGVLVVPDDLKQEFKCFLKQKRPFLVKAIDAIKLLLSPK